MNQTLVTVIAELLRQRIGLDPASLGPETIARAIDRRRSACGLSDMAAYAQRVQSSALELAELIEQVVVPETWFFRDRQPFVWLQTWLNDQGRSLAKNRSMRILSAPCATGEEPYSIAIALQEMGWTTEQATIEAIDICRHAIERATAGVYGLRSFRGLEATWRDQYFQSQDPQGKEWLIHANLRAWITFRVANLLELLPTGPSYDVIFCRNLVIYLDHQAREQVFERLAARLNPGGLLFVGAAEMTLVPRDRFESMREPFTFAYRRLATAETVSPPVPSFPLNSASRRGMPIAPDPATAAGRVPVATGAWSQRSLDRVDRPDRLPRTALKPRADITPGLGSRQANRSEPIDRLGVEPALGRSNPGRDAQNKRAKPSQGAEVGRGPDPLAAMKQWVASGEICKAIAIGQHSLSQDITNLTLRLLLADLHQQEGQLDEAEVLWRQALYLDPNCQLALEQLFLLAELRGNLVKAEILRQRLLRLANETLTA